MHGRVSPPGTQDWPMTADRAVSVVLFTVGKKNKADPNRLAAQAGKPEPHTRIIVFPRGEPQR